MRKLIPRPKGSSRPHMILPTIGRTNAVYDLIMLLITLDVVTNVDIIHIPTYTDGKTYYHVPVKNRLLRLLDKLGVKRKTI